MEHKLGTINKLILNTKNCKKSLIQQLKIKSNIYNTNRKKAEQEISPLNNKINLSSQKTSILKNKFKSDSVLYSKGAISKYELTETKNTNFDDKKVLRDINSSYEVKIYDF